MEATLMSNLHLNMLNSAIQIATNFHWQQLDKSGLPYIYHPLRVGLFAQQLGLDIETQCIGILHDVVEDTDCKLSTIYEIFGEIVGGGVDAMTRRNGKNIVNGVDETYFDFVRRCSLHPLARKIKLIDNADNMRPERKIPGLKLEQRYEKAARILWAAESMEVDGDVNSYTEFQEKFDKVVTWI